MNKSNDSIYFDEKIAILNEFSNADLLIIKGSYEKLCIQYKELDNNSLLITESKPYIIKNIKGLWKIQESASRSQIGSANKSNTKYWLAGGVIVLSLVAIAFIYLNQK